MSKVLGTRLGGKRKSCEISGDTSVPGSRKSQRLEAASSSATCKRMSEDGSFTNTDSDTARMSGTTNSTCDSAGSIDLISPAMKVMDKGELKPSQAAVVITKKDVSIIIPTASMEAEYVNPFLARYEKSISDRLDAFIDSKMTMKAIREMSM
jgi:hypothetical protein